METKIAIGFIGFWLALLGSWGTHIGWVITVLLSGEATNGEIALGVIGAFMPPVGAIHGVMIWFGAGF